jgi:hypothetical protein
MFIVDLPILKEPISGTIWSRFQALYAEQFWSEHQYDQPRIARWTMAGSVRS